MAADSKTVEGESAVVKAEEGNTATEQEPEAAPALSEERIERNVRALPAASPEGRTRGRRRQPTEKTLEIRRQIVAKKRWNAKSRRRDRRRL